MFERTKRKRNVKEGYPETKGLKDGHCNRSGCLRPLAGKIQYTMTDHETFTNEKLYYCSPCAEDFTKWDEHIKAPIRCTIAGTLVEKDWYEFRNDLRPGQIFRTHSGDIIQLDRSVPGDGTKWYVADWYRDGWSHYDSTIEPGDLKERIDVT